LVGYISNAYNGAKHLFIEQLIGSKPLHFLPLLAPAGNQHNSKSLFMQILYAKYDEI